MVAAPFPTAPGHLETRKGDQQWTLASTIGEHRHDLNAAIEGADRFAVYLRRAGYMAATISRTAAVVPAERIGDVMLPFLLVVYSADHDILVTGYQFSGHGRDWIPEDALWAELNR